VAAYCALVVLESGLVRLVLEKVPHGHIIGVVCVHAAELGVLDASGERVVDAGGCNGYSLIFCFVWSALESMGHKPGKGICEEKWCRES